MARASIALRASNVLLAFASVLVVLGVLEVGARIIIARRPPVTLGEQSVYSEADPLLGWRNRPGTSVTYRRREYTTTVAINSLGFRDIERTAAKAPGFGRIVAIGDSFVEGYSVERDEDVTRRAEAMSLSLGCQLDVVNAGVHAYSSDQEALWFIRDGMGLQPDVVVVFAYYNDILNNIRGRYWGLPKPLVKVVGDEILPQNLPLPGLATASDETAVQEQPVRVISGSALKEMIVGRVLMGAPNFYNRLAVFGLWDPWKPEPIPDELRAYKGRGQLDEFKEAWDNTAAIFDVLGRKIRAIHARPVLVHVPARFEISERDWSLTTIRYGIDTSAWDRTLVRRHLQEMASVTGWEFLDLTPPLEAATSLVGGEPYFSFDGHWNAKGHDIAARALVDFLKEKRLLPCGGAIPSTNAAR